MSILSVSYVKVYSLKGFMILNAWKKQKGRRGGGDRKNSKIVAILGPQNHKEVELIGPKIARKGSSQNFGVAFSAAVDLRPIKYY